MFPIRDHNPSGRVPYVTWALIAANILVFLAYLPLLTDFARLGPFYYNWAFIPARFGAGENIPALFTSMFLHGGWLHLIGNMLFLFIFGDNIEDELGHAPFLVFYVVCGVCATLLQYAAEPASPIPMVGASGAIAGVMGAYLMMFPKARIDIFVFFIIIFRVFPIPAWIMLCLWFVLHFAVVLSARTDAGGVAYWAHAGGFLAGIALIAPHWLRRGGTAFWTRHQGHPPHPEATYSRSRIPKIPRQ